jgi:hypothetical protein
MLWGIDPLLTADLLYALRRMGHGDEIVVVDTNFPADSTAMSTVIGEPIPLAGVNAARAIQERLRCCSHRRTPLLWLLHLQERRGPTRVSALLPGETRRSARSWIRVVPPAERMSAKERRGKDQHRSLDRVRLP